MKLKNKCPECGGDVDLVMNEYVTRAVCVECNSVFKVRLRLTKLYGMSQKGYIGEVECKHLTKCKK